MRFLIKFEDYDCGDYVSYYPEERTYKIPDAAHQIKVFQFEKRRFDAKFDSEKRFKVGFIPSPDNSPEEILSNIEFVKTIKPFDYNDKDFKRFVEKAVGYHIEKVEGSSDWLVIAKFERTLFVLDIDNLEQFVKIVSDASNSVDELRDANEFVFEDEKMPDYVITFN